LATAKAKLIIKILWQKEKVEYFPCRYLEKLMDKLLQALPMDNEEVTESQIDILVCATTNKKMSVLRDTNVE
jgi:hypothetical protein